MLSNDNSIDQRIVQLRKEKWGLFRIHKWLTGWDNFKQLDEQLVLAHILNVLDKNNLAVSRSEVKYCFLKFYNKKSHSDKRGYLNWLYKEFNVKAKTKVSTKRAHRFISRPKDTPTLHDSDNNKEKEGGE